MHGGKALLISSHHSLEKERRARQEETEQSNQDGGLCNISYLCHNFSLVCWKENMLVHHIILLNGDVSLY